MSDLTCGKHRAYAYSRGGKRRLFELTPLALCRWERVRDDISSAEVVVPTTECCGLLDDLRTVLNELHIYRNGQRVWQGPIVRLEYEFDAVRIFADDVLWQTKRAVINPGYNMMYPHMGLVLDVFDMLLVQAYERQGDPWNMLHRVDNLEQTHLHPIRTPGEPRLAKMQHRWADTVFNEIDKFGEDYGVDYTVIDRDVYYWDLNWAWKILPPLHEDFITDRVRIVEYGNNLYTRAIVTNGRGYAGIDQAGADVTDRNNFGFIDLVINNSNEDDNANAPSEGELMEWQQQALHNLRGAYPTPVGVVVPDNTTLLPGSPWNIDDLIPGAWFKVNITRLCRHVTEWNRLQRVGVEEVPPRGEVISISSVTAPREMHRLPP